MGVDIHCNGTCGDGILADGEQCDPGINGSVCSQVKKPDKFTTVKTTTQRHLRVVDNFEGRTSTCVEYTLRTKAY